MRYRKWSCAVLAAAALAVACSPSAREPDAPPGNVPSGTRVPGEYLVTLAPGSDTKAIEDAYGRFGIKGIKDLGNSLFLVTLTRDPGPAELEALRGQRIKAVQPNLVYRASGTGAPR